MPIHAVATAAAGRTGVLITRPEPGASETARRLASLGFAPVLAPVLHVVARTLGDPGTPQAVLVTSGNALAALPEALRGTLLLAVGDATAARARAAGFRRVHSAGRDAVALAEVAAELCRPAAGPLLLASGAGQGQALAADLRARGFRVRRRVAYAAQPATALPVAARDALDAGSLRAALFFSAQTARVFMSILQRDMEPMLVRGVEALALSSAVAASLRGLPWRQIRVASQPTQDALLALLT
jgi:uroporphyrinogen-III synthase